MSRLQPGAIGGLKQKAHIRIALLVQATALPSSNPMANLAKDIDGEDFTSPRARDITREHRCSTVVVKNRCGGYEQNRCGGYELANYKKVPRNLVKRHAPQVRTLQDSHEDTNPVAGGTAGILRYLRTLPEGPASHRSSQDDTGDGDSDSRRLTMYVVDAVLPEINPADLCEVRAATDIVFHEPLGNCSTPLKPSAPKVPKTLARPVCVPRRHTVSPEGGGVC